MVKAFNNATMKKIICLSLFLLFANIMFAQNEQALYESILSKITPPSIPEKAVNITRYGAKGDGVKDCKPAFDKAMKAALKSKGGLHIVVPAGVYFIKGPIHFVSNVCLDLAEGAELKFSDNPADYLPVVSTSWEGTFVSNYSPFIYGYEVENVSIIGKGKIDGNAQKTFGTWRSNQEKDVERTRYVNHNNVPFAERSFGEGHYLRPQLIQFYKSKNILLEGVFITNSPFWCIHLLKSENITCRKLKYDAKLVNNDGIDPEYSKNILIEDIDFNNGDDNVAIKAGRDNEGRATATPSENIIIRNCRFKGLHGVVFGSEMSSGIQNVFVRDCSFAGYCKRGIYFKTNPDRGGFIRNIYINNVEFDNVEDLFFITSAYARTETNQFNVTDICDVYVNGLKCKKASNAGLVIQGYPKNIVHDIHFRNVEVQEAKICVSFTNAERIEMSNVTIGGIVGAPSTVTDKDKIFEKK